MRYLGVLGCVCVGGGVGWVCVCVGGVCVGVEVWGCVCVCVGVGESVSAAKRGHTREISLQTEDTFHTVDGPRFAGGGGTGVQDDENDVKMLFRPWPLLGV